MSFYIDLPFNTISFPLLYKICYSRVNFLNIQDQDFVKSMESKEIYSDIMLPRSAKDNISHHLLRGLSTFNKDSWRNFVSNEKKWFKFCLLSMSDREYSKFLRYIDSSVKSINFSKQEAFDFKLKQDFLEVFGPIITQDLFQTLLTSHIPLNKMLEDENSFISVSFIHAPMLMAQRKLKIVNGMILIPLCYLKIFFVEVFQLLIEKSFDLYNTWAKVKLKQDPRMISILKCMLKISGKKAFDVKAQIRSDEIDQTAQYFPPCMEYLHSKLRFLHRLDHHSRIQYSLFLKGIGLPYEEALSFWKGEYEKPLDHLVKHHHHNCAVSSCTHVWGGNDSKRYHYNLRHLYGLEGARRNYACHSCTQIQGKILKNRDLGGCPFIHFDDANLKRFLKSKLTSHLMPSQKVEEITTQILSYRATKDYNKCCSLYYDSKKYAKIGSLSLEETTISNPTEFYFDFVKKG